MKNLRMFSYSDLMTDHDAVAEIATEIAAAIGRRDVSTLRRLMAPGFVHRSLGGGAANAEAFLQAIAQIPGEIKFVKLEQIDIDISPTGALVTGVQHAQVLLDGQLVDDRRAYVDWFVQHGGAWRVQAAVDLPHQISHE